MLTNVMKILPTKVDIYRTISVVRWNNVEVFRYPTNMVPQHQEAPNSYILKPQFASSSVRLGKKKKKKQDNQMWKNCKLSFYRSEKHKTFIKIKIIAFAK